MKRIKRPSVSTLLDELFASVHTAQGHGYFSDGEAHGFTHQQFFEQVRIRLSWNVEAVKIIRKFLRKYGESVSAIGEDETDDKGKRTVC